MVRDEISLLADKLVQLNVKSSLVVPIGKSMLLCSMWTQRSYNLDSFRAQMKNEDDLEMILERRPWLFRKQLIIFEKLKEAIERSKIKLILYLFWLNIGSCPLEYEKKDLMHAIGSTFGGVLQSEIKGDDCRLKVQLDIQKPLRRGIFISARN
ncbi:hypothetical protein Goari_023826 [Gossypium aridum]|uniref:DUF4283 domain-containing protein n=1 Tax=Gossypium aridum TaxID=34290 RepID=A0A7J8X480_GOSAI|nr:hypothetical protein [Gossypium aridum]